MPDITLTPIGPDDHARGPADAPITLIEYADFECPYCRDAHSIVQAVEARFKGQMRFVFRQFPLREIHPDAEAAAEAAEAAGAQGKFWEMYDLLFTNQDALGADALRGYARSAGVADPARFERELAAGEYRAQLDAAIARGEASGVDGTPMFFVNGQPFEGDPSVESLSEALEAARTVARG